MTTNLSNLFLYVAMYYWAMADRYLKHLPDYRDYALSGIPWLILPEAISQISTLSKAANFERAIPEYSKNYPWMIFPTSEELLYVTKENIERTVKHNIPENNFYSRSTVKERTCIDHFDEYNFSHHSYHDLRCFFLYSCVWDDVLRQMVNIRQRASEMYYLPDQEEYIDGEELTEMLEQFNWLALIYVVGLFYDKTGILMDEDWFNSVMEGAFKKVRYPEEMKDCIMKEMKMPEWVSERIENVDFNISEDDNLSVELTQDLAMVFRKMFAEIYERMYMEV